MSIPVNGAPLTRKRWRVPQSRSSISRSEIPISIPMSRKVMPNPGTYWSKALTRASPPVSERSFHPTTRENTHLLQLNNWEARNQIID